jgi:signal transduction histidine kinase
VQVKVQEYQGVVNRQVIV